MGLVLSSSIDTKYKEMALGSTESSLILILCPLATINEYDAMSLTLSTKHQQCCPCSISKIRMHCRRLQRAQEELEYYGAFAEHQALQELHTRQLSLQRCTVFSRALRRFQQQHHFHETYELPVLQSALELQQLGLHVLTHL